MARRVLLLALVISLSSLYILAQAGGFGAPPMPQSSQPDRLQPPLSMMHDLGSISGSVNSLAGEPLRDVQVQLRGVTGSIATSTYTDRSGAFSFNGVPAGTYEIVAVQGTYQTSDRVEVSSSPVTTMLRLPVNNVPHDGMGSTTISVAQYRVPDKARSEFLKAREATSRLKIDEAHKHVQRALEIYPNYADALTLRAILELNQSQNDAAVNDTQKAIQSDSNYALAYTVLASALNATGRFDEALQTLQRSESLAPDAWQTYYEEAKAYLGKADYQSTVKQLDRAKSLVSADFPQMHVVRARALIGLDRYAEAGTELETYLEKSPDGPEAEQARSMLAQVRDKSH